MSERAPLPFPPPPGRRELERVCRLGAEAHRRVDRLQLFAAAGFVVVVVLIALQVALIAALRDAVCW